MEYADNGIQGAPKTMPSRSRSASWTRARAALCGRFDTYPRLTRTPSSPLPVLGYCSLTTPPLRLHTDNVMANMQDIAPVTLSQPRVVVHCLRKPLVWPWRKCTYRDIRVPVRPVASEDEAPAGGKNENARIEVATEG